MSLEPLAQTTWKVQQGSPRSLKSPVTNTFTFHLSTDIMSSRNKVHNLSTSENDPATSNSTKQENRDGFTTRKTSVTYACKFCNKSFKTYSERVDHVLKSHEDVTLKQNESKINNVTTSSEEQEKVDEVWFNQVIEIFQKVAGEDNKISFKEFKTALEVKDDFFADRYFQFFDADDSGYLDLDEFKESLQVIRKQTPIEKLQFLFDIFDVNGDGTISLDELEVVLGACVVESNMKMPKEKITLLASAMMSSADTDNSGAITFEELQTQFENYPQVVENLSISPSNWLKVKQKKKKTYDCPGKKYFKAEFWKSNVSTIVFLFIFFLINIGLFILNCFLYKDRNGWIIAARGFGMCLNFDSAFILICMLRRTLTFIRNCKIGNYLPIDHSIEFHKLCAYLIIIFTIGHTIAHLGNIGVVTSNPKYNATYAEVLFTNKSKIGWILHLAYPCGVLLVLILILIAATSHPRVRRAGLFEVFYKTHKVFVAYWILLIVHCPNFIYWIILPGLIYVIEKIWFLVQFSKQNKSKLFFVEEVSLMPSKVTQIVISRPEEFEFKCGDYVFIKIPDIAKSEWHPFTISSAPEQEAILSLTIRGAGNWTNRLYDFYSKGTYLEVKDKNHEEMGPTVALEQSKNLPKLASIKRINDHRKCYLDGPYGAPTSGSFRTEHAILVAGGIGVTPFASILQSVLLNNKKKKSQAEDGDVDFFSLKKVDFIWVNRDANAIEWFLSLLSQLEMQEAAENKFDRFLDMHLFMTGAKSMTDLKGLGLQMALELLHKKEKKDLVTGLKTRLQPGRPNWNKLFTQFAAENHKDIHVFFCGPEPMAKELKKGCEKFGFKFSKENF